MKPINDLTKRYETVSEFAISDMYARYKSGESIANALEHPLLGSDYMNAFNDMYRAITGCDFVIETDTEDDIAYLLITHLNFAIDSMKCIVSND